MTDGQLLKPNLRSREIFASHMEADDGPTHRQARSRRLGQV